MKAKGVHRFMKFVNIVEEMKTVRDYKKELVDDSLIQKLIEAGNQAKGITKNQETSILFIRNGKEIYNTLVGKAGYYGKMIEAPHYLAIVSKPYPYFLENSGYIMEWIRLKAWELGLGTCWLSIEEEVELKKSLGLQESQEVTAFVAIGHPYSGIFKTDVSPKSGRMGIEDIVYRQDWGNPCSIEYLDSLGMTNIFYYTKFAPSWGNRQPWRFIVDEEKIFLVVNKEQEKSMKIDAGIVMLYFETVAREEGIAGSWRLDVYEVMGKRYHIPENYELIGYYNI